MADRESSSENNTRSRSVQDFVRTILHAVTNLQTQSGNPNRAENSSSAEFSSADEEINARFQTPRQDRRGIPNRSATSTRVVPSTAYNPRQNYSQVQRNVNRCPRRGRRNNYSTTNARGENSTEYVYKDICFLPDPEWIQVPRGAIKGNLVQRGLYIDAFQLDKNWSEARLYSELALLFKEALERPGQNDTG